MRVERWFVMECSVVPYDPAVHGKGVYKFLYFKSEREILLVGASDLKYHGGILDEYVRSTGMTLRDKDALKNRMSGVGAHLGNEYFEWYSRGFNLDTPSELRPRIRELLTEQRV